MKLKTWIIITISVLAISAFFIFNRWNKIYIDNGRNNNAIRIKVHVPIIEDNMTQIYAPDSFLASHWKTCDDFPADETILHYSKNITSIDPLNKVEEKDLFRKRLDSKHFYKLYIKSIILSNTHSMREGFLTIENNEVVKTLKLNEEQIDSVAGKWGLSYLIRGNIIVQDDHK